MTKSARKGMSAALLTSILLLTGACSKASESVSTQPTTQGGVEATSPTVKKTDTTEKTGTTEKTTDDTEVGDETPTTKKTPTTDKKSTTTAKSTATTKVSTTGPEFALTSVDALKGKLGEFKALEMTIHFASGFTSVQAQDPAKPKNVDEYRYKDGSIDGPTAVKLTGDGDLEENLFASSEIAWDKIPVMMEQAKTEIGELEGSKGVTHIIVKKNLPFDSDTVLDVYVDGGTRSDGGYVMFKADGTLKKVYGPS